MARKGSGVARRAGGSTRRVSTRWVALFTLVGMVAAGLMFRESLQAVHDTGAFELDGNSISNGTHDWENVYNDVTLGTNTSAAKAVSWVADGAGSASIFTGGGSKDPIDINQWAWKNAGGLPDKDNLTHSFAARYSLPVDAHCPAPAGSLTCEVLFFGSDRFDNSGDAQQGFWFFQNPVGIKWDSNGDGAVTEADANCPQSIGGGTGFCTPTGAPATHRLGDLLIISNFSNGGTVSTINVYKWNPAVSGNLEQLAASDSANCVGRPDGDSFCGLVNSGLAPSPWPFLDKSGNSSPINGELYEGGVNLSALNLGNECFSTVASETRSSTSTTAVLKDFVIGSFGKCDSALKTTPKDASGTDIPGSGISITTAGAVQVRDGVHLEVSGIAQFSGTLSFFLCGPMATGTCTTGGTPVLPSLTLTNQTSPFDGMSALATVTAAGRYCWRGEFAPTTADVPASKDASEGECFVVNPVTPTVNTTASADVTIGGTVTDSAVLAGTANRPGDPVINPTTAGGAATGTITFRLYGPADDTCTGTPAYTQVVNVNGDGTYQTTPFQPTSAGTYHWIASYTPAAADVNTLPNTNLCADSNEDVVVNPKTPTIVTVATAPDPTGLPLGNPISDTATLTGTAAPSNGVFGTITFRAYGPFTNTTTCTGTPAYTSVVTITGDGSYGSASGTGGVFTPTAAGNYNWIASYAPAAGDVNNVAKSGNCGDANEGSLLISLPPTMSTTQFFYPNDSATVTVSAGGGNLAGSVRFQAWTVAGCTGAPLIDQTVPISGTGALTKTLETTNTTIRIFGGSIFWKVEYTSTNPAHKNASSACGAENTVLNVTNGS